jgi:flavin-binding protein dodecin
MTARISRIDRPLPQGGIMANKGDTGVYRVTEVIGTSTDSWEDAARTAVRTAASTLRDLRIAEVTKLDVRLDEDGKIVQFRTRLSLSFKYEG